MRLIATLWVLSLPAWAQFIPGRYVVELNDPTVPATEKKTATASRTAAREAAFARRTQVMALHAQMRPKVEATGASVLDSVTLVGNHMFVKTDREGADKIRQLDGVKRVYPERRFRRVLDTAVIVHHVDQVWASLGTENAGAGIKIGIIDTGVDNAHPGMSDPSLAVPDGFPKASRAADLTFTSNKVIVARSYTSFLDARDPDSSPRDHVGHGTALAMIAAGVRNNAPLATITGIAPKAYIGSYKVFGTPGVNDFTNDSAIIRAIEDAVADGMDVINLSLGSVLAPRLQDDIEVTAVEKASSMGVIVVVSAGNDGPNQNTLSSPATAPSAIAVGASHNGRTFSSSVTADGMSSIIALNGDATLKVSSVSGNLSDVATLDGTGLACSSLPNGSLNGQVALMLRGTCTFEVKLNNAARAGATGAIIYTDDRPEVVMAVGTATIPAQMVSASDGMALKQALAQTGSLNVTMSFTLQAVRRNPLELADFSALGPSVDLSVKPDLMATGTDVYTATQSFDSRGDMFSSNGYIDVDGTSFSSPMVAGVAALLKAARPGLTVAQYRSLLINTAADFGASHVQETGAGILDALSAVSSKVTATPTSLSFGAGNGDPQFSRSLTISNLGSDDTFTVSVEPKNGSASPVVADGALTISSGGTATTQVNFSGSGLSTGVYEGFLVLQGTSTGARIRVPYWYAVSSQEAKQITVLFTETALRSFSTVQDAILFRVTNAEGVALKDLKPEVSVVSGTASVVDVISEDSDIPGLYSLSVKTQSIAAGTTFHIQVGSASADVLLGR